MNWFRNFSLVEVFLISTFALLYLIYWIRMAKIGKVLTASYRSIYIKFILRTTMFTLLIIAFLGPSFGESAREIKSIGKDIMICVDLSKSMDAFDIPPTRLEKVKFEMKRIIKAFHSDQIGIIIFSSEAFIQSPLTYDKNALNLFTETLRTGLVPPTGTDFEPSLTMALNKLNTTSTASQQKSKIIILISDGEDFGNDTEVAIEAIQEQDIKLFALGVGTEKGSQVRTPQGFKTDRQGKPVISRLNSSSLQEVARKTGGSYFEINENTNDVSRLIETINQIEGELKDTRNVNISDNQYAIFLLIALSLLLIDFLLSIKTIRL